MMLGEESLLGSTKPAQELVEQVKSGRIVAFVGSDLSRAAGFPGWTELLQALCDEALQFKPARKREIASAWETISIQPLHAANMLREILGPEFAGAITRHMALRRRYQVDPGALAEAARGCGQGRPWTLVEAPTPVVPHPTTSHRMLRRLNLPCLVTSGHDDLLERALDPSPSVHLWTEADSPDLLAVHKPALLKLRGDQRHIQELGAAPASRKVMKSLLDLGRPLWIGYGHDDLDFEPLLAGCRSLGVTGGVAIVSAPDSSLRQRLRGAADFVIELARSADLSRFFKELALVAERPVSFAVRLTAKCADERAVKRLAIRLEDLLDGYGVRTSVWHARPSALQFLLEADPPDFRALHGLLRRREQTLLEKLGALGVAACDEVEVTASVMATPSFSPQSPRSGHIIVTTANEATPASVAVPVPVYVPSGPPVTAVADLFARLFAPEELRAWTLQFAGSDVCHDIEFAGSPRTVALRAAEALQRHGLLTHPLIDALRSARPQRAHDVDALSRYLFPAPASACDSWDSYTLFSRLLDRDAAWSKLLHACDSKNDPVVFVLHGTPSQHLGLFLDRTHRFLDDEARDGVRREHQVFEVMFERDFVRLQTAEEWEASLRRAMGFAKGKPLADYLQRALTQHAVMFLIRGRDAAPLTNLSPTERTALAGFLRVRLPAILASLRPPNRALRFLIAIEHTTPRVYQDELFKTINDALLAAPAAERKLLELHFPTLDEVFESVERFLSDRRQLITSEIRDRCARVYERHEALGDAKNYRDLADDLYRELNPLLSAPHA
jgi:hypothetical protein